MILSDDYIYLHIPKTAGKAIGKFMLESDDFPNAKIYRYRKRPKRKTAHFPYREIPNQLQDMKLTMGDIKDKVFFASVRNPLSFYVSLYHYDFFQRSKKGKRFLEFLGNEDNEVERFQNWLKRMLNTENPRYSRLKDAKERGLGLYGYWHAFYTFRTLDFGNNEDIIKNYSKLTAPKFYLKIEKLDQEMKKHFGINTEVLKINKSRHNHFESYYDDETKNLVLEKDKYIFKMHY